MKQDRQQLTQELHEREARLREVTSRGAEALSDYDVNIAFGGDRRAAVCLTKFLLTNQIRWLRQQLEHVGGKQEQLSLF